MRAFITANFHENLPNLTLLFYDGRSIKPNKIDYRISPLLLLNQSRSNYYFTYYCIHAYYMMIFECKNNYVRGTSNHITFAVTVSRVTSLMLKFGITTQFAMA